MTADQYIKRLRVRARDEIKAYYDPCVNFTDINRSAWYHEGVDYVVENGIMKGKTATKFAPNDTLTREELVTILWRLDGQKEPTIENPFTDVKPGRFSTKAILWAYENNITKGAGANYFNRTGKTTRAELVTFLKRYADYAGYDTGARTNYSAFPDASTVPSWAKDAMSWAIAVGLVNGEVSHGVAYIHPMNSTSRAQIAAILLRFSQTKLDNQNDLVILYTNDVHCEIEHSAASFGYAGVAALKKDMESKHYAVGLVDAGDFIQGGLEGILTKGGAIVRIMNGIGYDAATLGNHEFDYGVDNLVTLLGAAEFPIVSCDITYTGPAGNANALEPDPYTIVTYGETKVAYVGISTPESLVKANPVYFQDEDGNWIYDFANDETGELLYDSVQNAVDVARADGADYVIALAHLGTDAGSAPWRSVDLIRNTTGIDAVLDGHSHTVIPCQMVANQDGREVPLTSTGTKLANVGKLTITAGGEISTELISCSDFKDVDEDAAALVAEVEAEFEAQKNQVVFTGLTKDLLIVNPDRLGSDGKPVRAVRYQETNMADICADALYEAFDTDIAFVNGGGVRDNIYANEIGTVTYGDVLKVTPFMNELLLLEASGQQIMDALEFCSRNTGFNEDGLIDGEFGSFMQVAGLKYTVYTGTASSITYDSTGTFTGVGGTRRVADVLVLNKTTGEYEPIDPAGTYRLVLNSFNAGGGDGVNMFKKCSVLMSGTMVDSQALVSYFESELFAQRLADGRYDNWDGEGRITIKKDAAPGGEEPPVPTAFRLSTTLSAGDEVVIYHPDQRMTLSTELNGNKVNGVAVTVEDNVLTPAETTAIYTVEYPEGDTTNFYLKMADGTYLTTGATGNSMSFETTPNDYSLWYLEVKDADAGTVFIRSTNAAFNGNKNQALEYYKGYTTYGWKDNANYIFQLYVKK